MKKLLLMISCTAMLFSCRKLDQPNTREFTDEAYWRDSQDALDALASCYENMSSDFYFFGNEALSDNAFVNGTGFNGVSLIAGGSYDQANGRVNDEWGYRFRAIRKCNIVTENINRVPAMDETLKKRIVAEARFIRAYSYFELVNWFGDVPFYTNLITIDEAKTISRTPKATILQFILKELSEIRADLPTNKQYAEKDRGRITRGAAIALTARVRLFTEEWPEVKKECELLMNSAENGTYSLLPNYADLSKVSSEFNDEVILDLQYGGGRTFGTQRSFLPQTLSLLRATLVPTQDLVDDYIMTNGRAIGEAGSGYDANNPYANRDPRLDGTILRHGSTISDQEGKVQTILTLPGSNPATNTVEDQGASPTGYYFYKFSEVTAANFASTLNLPLIRYADVLLMYAEAMAKTEVMDKAVWDKTVRALRVRAKFTDAAATEFPTGATQAQLLTIVKRERRAELAFEGLRAFDIRRWKIAATVLNVPVRGIKVTSGAFNKDPNGYIIVESRRFIDPKHYLWPVPTFERDQNKNLGQNDDWQ